MNFTIIDNPNQREREIIDNSWFVVKASPNLEILRQEESNSGMNFMIIDNQRQRGHAIHHRINRTGNCVCVEVMPFTTGYHKIEQVMCLCRGDAIHHRMS